MFLNVIDCLAEFAFLLQPLVKRRHRLRGGCVHFASQSPQFAERETSMFAR